MEEWITLDIEAKALSTFFWPIPKHVERSIEWRQTKQAMIYDRIKHRIKIDLERRGSDE